MPTSGAGDAVWSISAGDQLLRYRGAVYVPNENSLKSELLFQHHDSVLGGHFGVAKTLESLRRLYFWPQMKKAVKDHVKSCDVCQRTAVKRHLPYGLLSSFPVPSRP